MRSHPTPAHSLRVYQPRPFRDTDLNRAGITVRKWIRSVHRLHAEIERIRRKRLREQRPARPRSLWTRRVRARVA